MEFLAVKLALLLFLTVFLFASLMAIIRTGGDPIPLWAHRLLGHQIIYVKDSDGEVFKTLMQTDAWGEKFAYRYHSRRIGYINIYDDGTARYCGPAKWIKA